MLKKIILSSLEIQTTNKEGQPLVNKKGGNYSMAWISTEAGEKMSCYIDPKWGAKDLETMKGWSKGQEVELMVEERNGYLNFKIPGKSDRLEARIETLEKYMGVMKKMILELKDKNNVHTPSQEQDGPEGGVVEGF